MLKYVYIRIYITNYFEESWRFRVTWSLSIKQQRRSSGHTTCPISGYSGRLSSQANINNVRNPLTGVEKTEPCISLKSSHGRTSRGLERVQLKNVVIGWCGEVERLGWDRHSVITRTLKSQRALKVQELTHEVKVGRDVRLLHFDNVISVVHGQVELLHEVRHCYSDRTTDARKAVNKHAALLSTGLI